MEVTRRNALIGEDLVVIGEIRNGGTIEVHGLIEGRIAAERVVIHPGGRVIGAIAVENAEVHGLIEGNVSVRKLLGIGGTGIVRGDVRYGQILMSAGGELTAELRNVPPEIVGDFQVVVRRGRSVAITTADIAASDPDDSASNLEFTVARPTNGFIARAGAARQPIDRFTQSELAAGGIVFVHDGNGAGEAGFEVVVMDKAGATSGAPQAVQVSVV